MPATPKVQNNPNANLAVIYCRVSSDRQAAEDKTAWAYQEERGRKTAADLGCSILYVVRSAESAWVMDKRSEFQRVIADAEAGKFGVLIVDRINRFSRSENIDDALIVLEKLESAGVQVKFSEREYSNDILGRIVRYIDLGMSAKEQQERRVRSREGKRGRAEKHGWPIPGRRATYGFRWADAKSTRLMRDPDVEPIVRMIWDYFLSFQPTPEEPRASVRGVVRMLDVQRVPPPRAYQGIRNINPVRRPMRVDGWCFQTIRKIIENPVYWGQARPALHTSKYKDVAPIKLEAYVEPGAAYVTPAEAKRVHAMLGWNGRHLGRASKRDWGTLLHGGFARCAYCGKRLQPFEGHERDDGTAPIYYTCSTRRNHGGDPSAVGGGCPGVYANAAILDQAVRARLDFDLNKGTFLEEVISAWRRGEGAAEDNVRVAKAALDETESQAANLALWAARTPPDSPAGATLQNQLNTLDDVLPSLRKRYAQAQADAEAIKANSALADELRLWFSAWLGGFGALPLQRQRDFLATLDASVTVWQEDEPTRAGQGLPRAELLVRLPTDALELPPPMPADLAWMETTTDAEGWHLPLDVERAKQAVASAETFVIENMELDAGEEAWEQASAADVYAGIQREVEQMGGQSESGAKGTTSPVRS